MSQSQLLKRVVEVLRATSTPFMLTGSYASSLQGEPRLTHDIDLVVAIGAEAIPPLLQAFPMPDYYLDQSAIERAINSKSQFNLLDVNGGDKVDFWMLTDDPFDQSRFARRYVEEFEGLQLQVSRPEDTIIMKLRRADLAGGSQKQIDDARSVYEMQKAVLDVQYIERWISQLELDVLWKHLVADARPG